ncbi:MAG: tetratricopeptide repeat protein [Tepidimonas sp.]|nr:tetratricopeptide repeat protein [Tepidimonas sp.]MDW8335393.1 tetratricopeptide repeat protein [Tepidimonas sp.]
MTFLVALLTAFAARANTPDAALNAYRSGKTAQALQLLDEWLQNNPRDAQAQLLKGVVLAETGKTKEAKAIFQNLIIDYPQLPEPYNNLAVLYAAEGDFDKARAVLETAIKTNPSYAVAYENLGDVYAKLASQSYARALNLQPKRELQPKLRLINQVVALTPAAAASPSTASPAAAPAINGSSSVAQSASGVAKDTGSTDKASAGSATKESSSVKPTPLAPEVEQAVRAALQRWQRAWTSRDIQGYVDAYVRNYTPRPDMTHAQWVNERTARIVPRKRIELDIKDLQIQPASDGAIEVRFTQHYRSDSLDNRTRKSLLFVQQDGQWRIAKERNS